MRRPTALLPVLPLLTLLACPPDGGGGGETPKPLCEVFEGACVDLTPWIATDGSGARVRQLAEGEGLTGQAAQSKAGDWLLENDQVRFVVQGDDRHMGPAPWGGNLIDGEVVGREGRDAFGEMGLLINFGRTLLPERFEVVRDGSDGGAVVLAVTGKDTLNDFINVPVLFESLAGSAGKLWVDPDQEMGLSITHFYILNPGESRIRVVTAFRNDSQTVQRLIAGELMDSGGNVGLFNPTRPSGSRHGYPSTPLPEPADAYLAYLADDVAYAWAPVGWVGEDLESTLAMTVSGVTGAVLGAESLFDFAGERPERPPPGAYDLAPGETRAMVRDFYVGKDHAAVFAAWSEDHGTPLGTVQGTVAGESPPGTRVAAIRSGESKPEAIFFVEEGRFEGRLPPGEWSLRVEAPGYPASDPVTLTVTEDAPAQADLTLPAAGIVAVEVRGPGGMPVPAKVTFICVDTCPKDLRREGGLFRNTGFDPLPRNVQAVHFVGPSGSARIPLPPAEYQVVVSRGAEWSTDPAGWPQEKRQIRVDPGKTVTVDAEIMPVIDTSGWISADLHVHAINSPDSPVPNIERVLSFLAEGVDVIVSTDHDYVTDYAPIIESLGASKFIRSVAGDEVTSFEWGHFNAFPLDADTNDLNGGAIDWGQGEGKTMTPAQLFDAIRAHPGAATKVVQVNHPRGAQGYFTAIGLDTATGTTAADPRVFRMEPPPASANDTGLFDPSFTALEIYNGFKLSNFQTRTNDWFAFLQRGLVVTATAVSDTHRWYSQGVGTPHSWVEVGDDTLAAFDRTHFAERINAGRVIGSNGPFVRLRATDGTQSAGIGEVLSVSPGTEVTLEVEVQVPTWFGIDRIELYANIDGTDARAFEQKSELPPPTDTIPVDLAAETPVPGAHDPGNPQTPHKRYVVTRSFTVTPERDGWYVVMVRGSQSAFPVILEADVGALAFTNPVFIDTDGDGMYQAPKHFSKAAPRIAPRPQRPPLTPRKVDEIFGRMAHPGHGSPGH
ncbi:MAG: hypothetical protein D6729_07945 [Deltaproteobacteria bacterium]|nr:MAG: hypothetical protein D6729_07945 [Deltaproteobacteria bacterium]